MQLTSSLLPSVRKVLQQWFDTCVFLSSLEGVKSFKTNQRIKFKKPFVGHTIQSASSHWFPITIKQELYLSSLFFFFYLLDAEFFLKK